MEDFYDKYFQAICTNQCQDPLILELRKTIETLDDSNYEAVNNRVINILTELPPMIDKPSNLDGLMFVLTKATSVPAKSRPAKESKDVADLAVMLHKTTINLPEITKAQSAALSLGMPTGFLPDYHNPYYNISTTFSDACLLIVQVINDALAHAKTWKETMIHEGLQFRDYIRKSKLNPNHTFFKLSRDLDHMWEFLDNGRDGWRFVELPHNFYSDVLERLTEVVNVLQEVAVQTNYEVLRKIVKVAHEVGCRLNEFREMRLEAEEAWRQHYEKMREEADMKAEEHVRTLMEKMSFYEKTTGGDQQNEQAPGCFEDGELKALMEKEHTEMEATKMFKGSEEDVDDLDLNV
ncbi:hypothetical protein PRZ48_001934 [Zasmidium cellare]|uniref:Uncharacterized protein n=1 Tax=Zasmidium cellare TaxID=395010 RepID=A0ABR0F4C1_ZASCE|nr:hypothetical protein PRZ48_001934 [Zasmidium cellare]